METALLGRPGHHPQKEILLRELVVLFFYFLFALCCVIKQRNVKNDMSVGVV